MKAARRIATLPSVSNVVSGKELEQIINELMATPTSVVDLMNRMMKP